MRARPVSMFGAIALDGKALRTTVPRAGHAAWEPSPQRDALGILRAAFASLQPELRALRGQRMARSPFAFFRGSAAVMAADLAVSPVTGIHAQLGGDAHLANFGGYASPERRTVFDVNDFDETARGPWEWDVKRLAVSIVLACRGLGLKPPGADDAVRAALAAYREHTRAYAAMNPLDVWYASIDARGAVRDALDTRAKRGWERGMRDGRGRTALALLPQITARVDGRQRFVDDPPLLQHVEGDETIAEAILQSYRASLRYDAHMLLDRYALVDVARKVVGIGSVGRWCALALLEDERGNPLLLEVKEATASVLEPYVGAQPYTSHAERVVAGTRMMQAASDVLLGWADVDGRAGYVRQYRDSKISPDLTSMRADELTDYGAHCAWALARAHARTGDARAVGAYLGRGDAFDDAIRQYARAYADEVEKDHAAFVAALPTGGFLNAPEGAAKPNA